MAAWTPSPRPDDAIVGVRLFRVAAGGMLQSLNHGCGWLPGVNDAEPDGCRCKSSPGHDCHCGLNAFHDLERAAGDSYRHYAQWAPAGRRVVAAVAGWGDVEVHADGWRSQHAEVLAIGAPDAPDGTDVLTRSARDLAARAAARYGVPLVAVDRLESYAREHGQPARPEQIPRRFAAVRARAAVTRRQHPLTGHWAARALAGLQVLAIGAVLAGLLAATMSAVWLGFAAAFMISATALHHRGEGRNLAQATRVALFPLTLVVLLGGFVMPVHDSKEPGRVSPTDAVGMFAEAEQRLIEQGEQPQTPSDLAATNPRLQRALVDVGDVLIDGSPGQGLRLFAVNRDGAVAATRTVPWPRQVSP